MRIICLAIVAVVLAAIIVGDVLCSAYNQVIMTMLCGTGKDFSDDKTQAALAGSDEVVQTIAEEGVVMLKNENNALPLASDNLAVNLFGWASHEWAFHLTGGGSAKATIHETKKVSLSAGFVLTTIAFLLSLISRKKRKIISVICSCTHFLPTIRKINQPVRIFYKVYAKNSRVYANCIKIGSGTQTKSTLYGCFLFGAVANPSRFARCYFALNV